MNVVALAGVSGISHTPVTHGLGAIPTTPPTPPANPLLALGGGEDNEEWWQRNQKKDQDKFDESYGYFKVPKFLDADVSWEFDDTPYEKGKPISLGAFTSKALHIASGDTKETAIRAIADQVFHQDTEERKRREKIVKVTITVAGASYILWRIIPLLA